MSELKPRQMTMDEAIGALRGLKMMVGMVGKEALDIAISALRRAQPDNAPLTLEELRGMDGEPVWIEALGDKAWWIVIRSTERGKLTTDYGGWFDFRAYSKTWLAYRRKPEPEGGEG